jgi:hypothetical protein
MVPVACLVWSANVSLFAPATTSPTPVAAKASTTNASRAARARRSRRDDARIVRRLARGVELIQEIRGENERGGPLVATALKIDPSVDGVRVEAALGGDDVWNDDPTLGREAVSKLVARRGAVAGINAGFFPFAGNPIGLHMQKGAIVTEPTLNRSSFLITQHGAARVAAFAFDGAVMGDDSEGDDTTKLKIHGLNRKPGKGDELLVFTPIFGPKTLRAPDRYEVVLNRTGALTPQTSHKGRIGDASDGGGTTIPSDGVVLSAGGASAQKLRALVESHKTLTIRLSLEKVSGGAVDLDAVRFAVTGAPRIVTGGRIALNSENEKIAPSFSTTRHPRTLAGVTADGSIVLAVVDGRQSGLSRGATLTESAGVLLGFGVVEGINLDGGGSSALSVRGAVANSPSEGAERPIADALLVFADEIRPEKDAPELRLKTPKRAVAVGERVRLSLPEDIDRDSVVFSTKGGKGFVDQSGVFVGLRPGKATIWAFRGGEKTSVAIDVVSGSVAAIGDDDGFSALLSLSPDPRNPKRATLSIKIQNAEGDRLGGEAFTVTVTGGVPEPSSGKVDARAEASIAILWDDKPGPEPRLITVTSPGKRFKTSRLGVRE